MDIQHKDFNLNNTRVNFGCEAEFSAEIKSLNYSDNYSQITSEGLNFITMNYNAKFNNLTDIDSQNIIAFLQSQFYYEPQDYSSDGSFSNKRVDPFDFQPSFPYKNLKFNCLNFNHNKVHYNVNNIGAQFTCTAPSILDSIESANGYNSNIDSLISIGSSLPASDQDQNISISNDNNNSHDLQAGNYIYASGDYRNAQVTSDNPSLQVEAKCGFPAGTTSTPHNNLRHSIFIDNPNQCSFYPHKPIHNNTELNVRFFDFRPNQAMSIEHSPKFRKSSASAFYSKISKLGYNPNLKRLSLSFSQRSNLEAKSILLFLESHLGYKKFGFHFQRDYNNKDHSDRATTPHSSDISFFYCPNWTHTFNYHDNHTISAVFIECPSS
jgi:phage-related protein